jgi:hypothetical protein
MLEMMVDTVPPTVSISRLASGTLTAGTTATIAFTLSEPATDFTAADVSVTGGSLTGFTGAGTAYTATFVPAERFRGSATVAISAAAFTDAVGNPNPTPTPLTIPVDTIAPTIIAIRSMQPGSRLGIGDTLELTATISETVTPGGSFSVKLNSGGIVSFRVDSSGTVARGIYTVRPGEESTRLDIERIFDTDGARDVEGNALTTALPPPSASLAAAQAVVVDATIRFVGNGPFGTNPAVVADAGSQFRRVTIRFTTPVRGVSINAFELTLGGNSVSLGSAMLHGSGANYVLLLPLSRYNPIGIYTLSLRLGHAISAVSNGAAATDRVSLHWGFRRSIGMLPSAPSSVTHQILPALGSRGSALVAWQPAAGNGGGTVTQYMVEYRLAGTSRWTPHRARILGSATSVTISGLLAGRSYEFRVAAQNIAGIGEFTLSTAVPGGAARASAINRPQMP